MAKVPVNERIESALAQQQAGQINDAKASYESLIADHPEHPAAYHLLGLLFACYGHPEHGLKLMRKSLDLSPQDQNFQNNFIKIHIQLGKIDQAISALEDFLKLTPNDPQKHLQLGRLLISAKRYAQAQDALQRSIKLGPNELDAKIALGHALLLQQQIEQAESLFLQILETAPQNAPTLMLIGNLYFRQGRITEALAYRSRAISEAPTNANAHYNLGNALYIDRNLDAAKTAFRKAIGINPNMADSHTHLGKTLMLEGNFADGWPEYEWRWKGDGFPNRQAPGPLWDGRKLENGTLLLTTEQGYGDAFQFIRFAQQAKEASGARVIVEAQASIAELMASAPGVNGVVKRGTPLPPFNAQAPLMTLPLILKTTIDSIPAEIPYLSPKTDLCQRWAQELSDLPGQKKVGLIWRGNPDQLHNVYRSCPVEALAPLLDVDAVTIVGLQKDPTPEELAQLPGLVDFGSRLKTFSDTAAIMANLDLVVSVCTSTAHLAGALARPTWVMLSAGSDWRWFLERDDSPWYPTARLFRQKNLHDWAEVTERLACALSLWATTPDA